MNNLKAYNTEFQCTLSVDALAEKLLETIYPKNVWIKEYITVEIETIACGVKTDLLDGKDETDANDIRDFCIQYLKNLPYHIRLVESIIDGIKDNSNACSNVFNNLHGWVKLPTPSDTLTDKEITEKIKEEKVIYKKGKKDKIRIAKLDDDVLQYRVERISQELVNMKNLGECDKEIEHHEYTLKLLEEERLRRENDIQYI